MKEINVHIAVEPQLSEFLSRPYEAADIGRVLTLGNVRVSGEHQGRRYWACPYLVEFTEAPPDGVARVAGWSTLPEFTWDVVKTMAALPEPEPGRILALASGEDTEHIISIILEATSCRAVLMVHFVAYFSQRYPGCTFWLTGQENPALVMQNGTLVGLIMPQHRPELCVIEIEEHGDGDVVEVEVLRRVPVSFSEN